MKCVCNKIINKLLLELEYAYKDDSFGIYTRKGFIKKVLGKKGILFFLDFHDVSNLNKKYGYSNVNKKFRTFFKEIKKEGIVCGRYFSGDEIILFSNSSSNIDLIKNISKKYNLFFEHDIYSTNKCTKKEIEQFENVIIGEL